MRRLWCRILTRHARNHSDALVGVDVATVAGEWTVLFRHRCWCGAEYWLEGRPK